MQGAVRFAAAILALFGVACASIAKVNVDQRRDLAGCRTWNFLWLGSGYVRASGADAQELDATLTRLVEQGLLERGFDRVRGRPDLFVTYLLQVRRQIVHVSETPAVEQLSSLDSSPSYEVQATERRVESYEIGNLTILVSDPDEHAVVWRGEYAGRFRNSISTDDLEDAVSSLLERLVASVPADASGECAAGPTEPPPG